MSQNCLHNISRSGSVTCHLKVDQVHYDYLGPYIYIFFHANISLYATGGIVINLGALKSSFSHLKSSGDLKFIYSFYKYHNCTHFNLNIGLNSLYCLQ